MRFSRWLVLWTTALAALSMGAAFDCDVDADVDGDDDDCVFFCDED